MATSSIATASEADAKKLLKAMSTYMADEENISFGYDVSYELVTKQQQKLALLSSGTILLERPDKVRVTRTGGFADVVMTFDGKNLTLFGKSSNRYARAEVPGTVDHLIDELRDKFDRPLPGADLLLSNVYDVLMKDVVDVKDLGSGVIGGVECDHLAFRTSEVDWQIWIAQGERPYPCRYTITTKNVSQAPQFTVEIRDWKTGDRAMRDAFVFKNTTGAKALDAKEISELKELPDRLIEGGTP